MVHPIKKPNESDKNIPSKHIPSKNSGLWDFFLNLNNILSHPNSKRYSRGSGEEEKGDFARGSMEEEKGGLCKGKWGEE